MQRTEWTQEEIESYERQEAESERYHASMQSWQEYGDDK